MKFNKTKCFGSWAMALCLALFMLIPFSAVVSASATTISIGAPAMVEAGSIFVVDVNIEAVTNLNGYQFDLTYDNAVIQVADPDGGTGVTSGLVGSTTTPINEWGFIPPGAPGTIRVFGNLPGISGVTGEGYLAQIQFNAAGTARQSTILSISNLELLDNAGSPIPAAATGVLITVVNDEDDTPPEVLSVNPANAASGIDISTSLTVTFSEAMKNSTITSASFSLKHGTTPVTGNVSSSANIATFTPSTNLAYNTVYVVIISTGVTDLANNALASSYSWSFTTGGQPPSGTLVSVNPPSGSVTQGSTFFVIINVGAVTNLNGCQFDLRYDNSVIQVAGDEGIQGVSNGLIGATTVPIAMWGFIPTGIPGNIRILEHLAGAAGATGQGNLAQIQFKAVGTTGQSSNLTLSNTFLYDSVGNTIPSSSTNGAVTVVAFPLEITTASLSEATVDSGYSNTLSAEGGTSPYTWTASGLPSGLTMSTEGAISGSPALAGDFNINVTVTDSFSPANTIDKTLVLHIYPALQITTSILSGGSTAVSYLATLGATGGKSTYTWSASGLPAGLTLSTAGVISGKPGLPGNFNVNVMVTDSFTSANSVSKLISLKIYLAGDVNGDGVINMADVTKAERIILNLDPPTPGADANGDGQINIGDITKIETIILGL
jgi:hypothetical protein